MEGSLGCRPSGGRHHSFRLRRGDLREPAPFADRRERCYLGIRYGRARRCLDRRRARRLLRLAGFGRQLAGEAPDRPQVRRVGPYLRVESLGQCQDQRPRKVSFQRATPFVQSRQCLAPDGIRLRSSGMTIQDHPQRCPHANTFRLAAGRGVQKAFTPTRVLEGVENVEQRRAPAERALELCLQFGASPARGAEDEVDAEAFCALQVPPQPRPQIVAPSGLQPHADRPAPKATDARRTNLRRCDTSRSVSRRTTARAFPAPRSKGARARGFLRRA